MAIVNLGKIKPLFKGAYSGAITYRALDFVLYNAALYVAKQTSIGNLPTDTSFFDVVSPAKVASDIANTPVGNISATTVQAALNELDTEKANLVSPVFTGTPLAPTAAVGIKTTQLATTAFGHSILTGRNRIINGLCQIDQRNAGVAQTITAGAALAYTADRFYAYCTGANITGQQITANGRSTYRFTGAAGNTAVGFGQRIEAQNSYDLAGTFASMRVNIASTSLTSITWKAFYANTNNTFGTLATPTRTQFATGTFTVSSTDSTKIIEGIVVPAAAFTGIEIEFTGGALLGSQTLSFGDVQLEAGSIVHELERLHVDNIIGGCQRYYQITQAALAGYVSSSVGSFAATVNFEQMRAIPTTALLASVSNVNSTAQVLDRITNNSARIIANNVSIGTMIWTATYSLTAEI